MSDAKTSIAIVAAEAAPRTKPTNYPEPFASRMAGREKRPLGDVFGFSDDDLRAVLVDGNWQFAHKDGTPY